MPTPVAKARPRSDASKIGNEKARGAAKKAQDGGLKQNLSKNIAIARPQTICGSRLPRPFRHGNKHHVHNDNAGNNQGDGTDRHDGHGRLLPMTRTRKLRPASGASRSKLSGSSGFRRRRVAHGNARLLLRLRQAGRRVPLHINCHRTPAAPDLFKGKQAEYRPAGRGTSRRLEPCFS